jgi:glycosyltransferase involved in cell wall biosynthesis
MNDRITVLFPITDLARDGAQRQLLELVRGLNKERFRPIVLSLHSNGPLEEEFREVPGVRVMSLERKGKYDVFCLFKVIGILRRLKVKVIQPFLTPATLFGLLPALLCRTPVKIVTERAGPRKGNAQLGYRLYLKTEDFLSRFADWAVANSEAGREYLIRRGINPNRLRVIYNGLNLNRLAANKDGVEQVRQRLGLPQGGKVVGMMARLFPVKNHATFLQAAALVNAAVPDTRFALLGDGPFRGYLEQLTTELGLSSKVTFWGEQQDVGIYLSALDIAVLTSDTEGCSNSLLESMALGKPVVATDVGGNWELVKHSETGFLVAPGNAQAVAAAVIALLRDPKLAENMGQRAKNKVVTQFSLERMVHEYQSLYEATLKQKAGRSEPSESKT